LDNCENFVGNGEELVLDAFIDSVILSQWIELRMEVIGLLQDLGALTSTNIHDIFLSTGISLSEKYTCVPPLPCNQLIVVVYF